MACLRCGKKTEEKQSFCEACLEDMQRHPVKPGTAIHLPQRDAAQPEKKAPVRRRAPEAAEQIAQLRKLVRWLLAMIALVSVLLLLVTGMLLHLLQKDTPTSNIGRNYTTSTSEVRP